MAKPTRLINPPPTVAQVAATAVLLTQYTIGKYNPKPVTKCGAGNGNSTTFAAMVAAANAAGGSLTLAQAQGVCLQQQHKGWLAYALRHKYLIPVQQPVA